MAWYWHRVVELLEARQREAIAVELPADDEQAGLRDYAKIVVRAVRGRHDAILVAQSLGGFTAPLVTEQTSLRALVFINAMIPLPGESVGTWGDKTCSSQARVEAAKRGGYSTEFDERTYFLHDVSSEVQSAARAQRKQSDKIFEETCDFSRWPSIPIQVVASEDDRFFPVDFQRRVARNRLGIDVVTLRGGHLVSLANPQGVVEILLRFDEATKII